MQGDEEKIASQIKEAEALIESETSEHHEKRDADSADYLKQPGTDQTAKQDIRVDQKTVGPTTNQAESDISLSKSHTNANSTLTANNIDMLRSDHDVSKDNADEEVILEADEDTVIY